MRISLPPKSTPLIRVLAVKGIKVIPLSERLRPRRPKRSLASTTTLRPSGVSSAREDSCAASASSSGAVPSTGMKACACRLPRVMVPVLSSIRMSTSPAASMARPLMASTLA